MREKSEIGVIPFLWIRFCDISLKLVHQLLVCALSAIPFFIAWNVTAPVYLTFIPKLFHHISYWHFVLIFFIIYFVTDKICRTIISLKG